MELIIAWMLDTIENGPYILALALAAAGAVWLAMRASRLRLSYLRLFFWLAVGGFILSMGLWWYLAFQAMHHTPPGSFRIKGVVYAERVSHQWGFERLHEQIVARWLYLYPRNDAIPGPAESRKYMKDGLIRAEAFRRSLLEDDLAAAYHIARGILAFQTVMMDQPGAAPLSGFILNEDSLVGAIAGANDVVYAESAFMAFRGRWYGEWDGMEVDHHWSRIERFEPPDALVDADARLDVTVQALQYAWVGDGFGWNAVILTEAGRALLGAVYHVQDGDVEAVRQFRPHVGIALDAHRLIWITESEIFLEEALVDDNEPRYIITGFQYSIEQDEWFHRGSAFQAVYTRDPAQRPAFLRFSLLSSQP